VATQLGVERIGPQHQAGSDSLLTSATFMKLLTTHLAGVDEAASFLGVLHQLGEDGERPCHDRL
jgi:CCR4-NOT transcription complex subunit 7/8